MRPLTTNYLQGLHRRRPQLARQFAGCCQRCSPREASSRRWNSGAAHGKAKEKPFYVTTPIFYVNAAPHIGHLYTTVLCDVIKRWQQVKGREAYLCTGTDEHGMKIQRAAAKEGIPPKEFCDANAAKFRDLAQMANISNDFFIRTTDQDHKDAVAQFWLELKYKLPEGLGLYKGSHEGWYCVSDECFYPEDMVQPSIVPQTGKKIMINTESENEVEWIKEETWFFPLTKYRDALLKFYDENPDWIKPEHRMNEVRDWVKNHLEDLSITRPHSRLSWGIPDPEDPSQTIYVWVDALINYITKAGYAKNWQVGSKDTGLWPADIQVIGKDILRFHAIYWPALLLAVGLQPAKKLVCHNHWTMSNRKMSKSLGNVVNPVFAIQRWDVDPLRYFLMRNGSFAKDMSYSNDVIGGIYVKELQANIGNLFYRIAKPKANARWSLRNAVKIFHQGGLTEITDKKDIDPKYLSLEPHLARVTEQYVKEMDDVNTGSAIREIFELLRETNRYVTDTEPWKLAKQEGQETQDYLNLVVFNCGEALRIAGILLQPIMPSKTERLLNELGVSPDRRTLAWAQKGTDNDYGTETAMEGDAVARTHKWDTIFPPTASVELSDQEVLQLLRSELASNTRNKMNQMAELLALEARLGEEGVNKLIDDAKLKASRQLATMKRNEFVALSTSKVLLVPYEAHHVVKYHGWMQDPAIQEATASEPMTLDEEYENQQSWRTSPDKLTFIICSPLSEHDRHKGSIVVTAKNQDKEENMKGDVNFFLYPADDDEEASQYRDVKQLVGEVDVMIAGSEDRGQGFGEGAVRGLLIYIQRDIDALLEEYAKANGGKAALTSLMVKIKEANAGSRALFQKLGFKQKGDVNYFGEITMAMDWADGVRTLDAAWQASDAEYREIAYRCAGK